MTSWRPPEDLPRALEPGQIYIACDEASRFLGIKPKRNGQSKYKGPPPEAVQQRGREIRQLMQDRTNWGTWLGEHWDGGERNAQAAERLSLMLNHTGKLLGRYAMEGQQISGLLDITLIQEKLGQLMHTNAEGFITQRKLVSDGLHQEGIEALGGKARVYQILCARLEMFRPGGRLDRKKHPCNQITDAVHFLMEPPPEADIKDGRRFTNGMSVIQMRNMWEGRLAPGEPLKHISNKSYGMFWTQALADEYLRIEAEKLRAQNGIKLPENLVPFTVIAETIGEKNVQRGKKPKIFESQSLAHADHLARVARITFDYDVEPPDDRVWIQDQCRQHIDDLVRVACNQIGLTVETEDTTTPIRLPYKEWLYPLLTQGKKTLEIRLITDSNQYQYKAGQRIHALMGKKDPLALVITSATEPGRTFGSITEEEAKRAGADNLDQFKEFMNQMHRHEISPDQPVAMFGIKLLQ